VADVAIPSAPADMKALLVQVVDQYLEKLGTVEKL
jgi:hypothetical protein